MASSQDWHKETRSHKPGHSMGRAGKTEEGLPELGIQGRAKVGHGVLPTPGPQRPGHFPGVCPPLPVHLVDFMLLELLQLLLEAQVGVGAGAASAHCVQRIFPAQVGHCHEVGDDQRHAPRHSS